LKLETRLDETRRKTSIEWTLYSGVEQCSHSHIFLAENTAGEAPTAEIILNKNKDCTKKPQKRGKKNTKKQTQDKKNYTKASIHNRYSGRFCSLNLCA